MKIIHTKKIACPACGAALTYDPETGKMKCGSCGSTYTTEELATEPAKSVKPHEGNEGQLECRVYRCSSCGAELNVNSAETSTFCPYCGQPTLLFDRIATMNTPDLIIPFSVTREKAASLIREKLRKEPFVPRELRDVPLDQISGIYIPYWIYDIDYEEKAYLSGFANSETTHPDFFYLNAERHFEAIPAEGASRLDDELSKSLAPYHIDGARPFDPSCLSGFYSDRCDADPSDLENAAAEKARDFLENDMMKKIHDEEDMQSVTIQSKTENFTITDRKYALFPAWFLTFRWKNKPVTILVNGQTEKLVGGLPVNRGAFFTSMLLSCLWAIPVGIFFTWLTMWMHNDDLPDKLMGYAIVGLVAFLLIVIGAGLIHRVKKANQLSQADNTHSYAFDREKGGKK